jgi:CRISPR-associated protein Cas5h
MENSTLLPSNQVLIFDVESEYGHFRKFNTTTSPLTYSIPTRPAIAGLIGAILGIEREVSAENFREGVTPVAELFTKEKASFAVQIINPTKKVNIGFNLLDTEKTASSFFNVKQRTQIEFELLKNPKFRIYVSLRDSILFSTLVEKVQLNQAHFTPYLGLSQFTASTKFIRIVNVSKSQSAEFQEVLTAVNLNNADADNPIEFDYTVNSGFKYTSDTMPIVMQANRIVTEYSEVILETSGKPIKVKSDNIFYLEDIGNIIFL